VADEARRSSLHSALCSSQLSRGKEICPDMEMSVTDIDCGYSTNVKMVTAWAILLASYACKSNVSISAVKELVPERSFNSAINWCMGVTDLIRHIQDQLGNISSGALQKREASSCKGETKRDQHYSLRRRTLRRCSLRER
jgi:hypothetical protein